MSRVIAIARRIINQVRNDHRTVGLLFVAPLLMLTILWLVLSSGLSHPTIALHGAKPRLADALRAEATVIVVSDAAAGRELVRQRAADGFVDLAGDAPVILIDGADPAVAGLVGKAVQKATVANLADNPIMGGLATRMQPDIQRLHGDADDTLFDAIAPLLMGFVIFFFSFILGGINFLRERLDGTLDRILVGPTGRMELVLGYLVGFGCFALVQTVLIQLFMVFVLGIRLAGDFGSALVLNILLGLSGLSLGSLISAFARNEFQVFQFIPLIIVPQILFAGIFDLRGAPEWLQACSWAFPLYYGGEALRDVMIRGQSLLEVWPWLAALVGFIVVFLGLSSLSLRRRD